MLKVELLKAEFVKKGYTQKDIASFLGVSPKTLYNKLKQGTLGVDEAQILIDKLEISNPAQIFFATL